MVPHSGTLAVARAYQKRLVTDRGSPVTGHRLLLAGRGGQQDRGMNRPRTHKATELFFFSAVSASLRCKFPTALKMKKSPATPLECTLTENAPAKSFGIHSYKFIGLKVPWNEHLQKIPGGGGGWRRRIFSPPPSHHLGAPNAFVALPHLLPPLPSTKPSRAALAYH